MAEAAALADLTTPLTYHGRRPAQVDAHCQGRNHNYMNARHETSALTDGVGTGGDAPPGGGTASAPGIVAPEHGSVTGSDRATTAQAVRDWFAVRLPADWFTAVPDIQVDREEIVILGRLADPATTAGSDAERSAAAEGRIRRFREETRTRRIEIAREAEHRFRRKVSWGVACAGEAEMFTTLSVPVMTRLRQPERRVLDTLVDAGVARSRSDALAWCVRLTGENADSWLSRLRAALRQVQEVRDQGPGGPERLDNWSRPLVQTIMSAHSRALRNHQRAYA